MNESQFYQLAKRKLEGWEWDRIENTVSSGMPDTIIYRGFVKRQLELKIVRSGKMYFTPAQISWATRMKNAGIYGNYVLAYNKETPILMYYNFVIDEAKTYKDKRKYVVNLKDVSAIYTGWAAVKCILGGAEISVDRFQ